MTVRGNGNGINMNQPLAKITYVNNRIDEKLGSYYTKTEMDTELATKQATLVSGTNIKTVNGNSLLGSGDIAITGGADFDITPEHNIASTSANGEHLIFDFTETDTLTARASIPNSWEKERILATKGYVDGKSGVNMAVGQEIWYGTYTDENNVTYQTYSKTVYIPALPDTAGITTYEHGVSNIKQILDIYGSTTDGFVLNAPRQNAVDNISIYQASKSASNKTFSIEVGKDRSNKSAYVTMIYAKNN